ncbi:Docking protein 5 [Sarcoptes scabiei]|uniref:Docking protein 5 n=1 Tax=Sarcoptes scabiei TaxID=52283 RepID=A0A131ZT61_SARSC|nr:Docking protein 5 [Sarcoptes scabiei]KPL98200.1 IRS and PH domain containing protein [Sarcoptes scabiei]
MATDLSDVIKQGYMRCKSRSLGLWQKRWIILRRTSSKGPCRFEKYLNESSARNLEQHKVQLLTNVISVVRSNNRKHAFQIVFNDGSSKFYASDSETEVDVWVKLTAQECFLPSSSIANGEPDILKPGIQKELQEQFKVYLMPSSKLEIFGECFLQVTHENIYLWDSINSKIKLCAWPLTALRRYGSDLTKFTFEAGRHCATGEGMFIFHTLEGEKIYKKVHQATLSIAEAHQKMKKQGPNNALSLNTTSLTKNDSFKLLDDSQADKFSSNNLPSTPSTPRSETGHRNSWYHSDNESTSSILNNQVYNKNMIMGVEI